MSLSRTLAITGRLLTAFRHDHRTLGILFVTPLLLLGLFAILFRTDAPAPTVGIRLESGSAIATLVSDALHDADPIDVCDLGANDDPEALVRDGTLDAAIVLPEVADLKQPVEIIVEGTDPSVRGIVQGAVQGAILVAASRALEVPGSDLVERPSVEVEVRSLFGGDELDTLDLLGGPFIGLLVFFLVYVVTSISFLRERSEGTLERLMASPLRRSEIVVGYMLGFMAVALVQAAEVIGFALLVIGIYNAGSVALLLLIVVLLALGAVNLGIFLSTFARNEFQAVQFIPLVLTPQVLLSGLIVPVASEPGWLQAISNVLPLTYAVDALRDVMLRGADLGSASVQLDLAVLAGFCVVVIVAASLTLRREVA